MRQITGLTIKAYREHLQLSQAAFAEALEVSQGLVSAVELGRTPVSRKIMRQLRIKADRDQLHPTLAEYLGQVGLEDINDGRKIHVLTPMPLEIWQARIHLRKPADSGVPSRIVLPGVPDGSRAFQFSPPPPLLAPDEVAVFGPGVFNKLTTSEVVLVQLRRGAGAKGLAAGVAHLGRVIVTRRSREMTCLFESSIANMPVLELTESNVDVVMPCVFRGRYYS